MYFRNFSPKLVGKSPTLVSIDGGSFSILASCTNDTEFDKQGVAQTEMQVRFAHDFVDF